LETELQETGFLSDSVPSIPTEDLFLDEDESETTQGCPKRNVSPFKTFDPPHISRASLLHSVTHTADEILFDLESEDGHDSVDMNQLTSYQKTPSEEISIDVDENDEDEFQELAHFRIVGPLAASGDKTISAPAGQSQSFFLY